MINELTAPLHMPNRKRREREYTQRERRKHQHSASGGDRHNNLLYFTYSCVLIIVFRGAIEKIQKMCESTLGGIKSRSILFLNTSILQ